MADEANEPTRSGMQLRAQYIKDLSFENPRAPAALFSLKEPPQMEVSMNTGISRLDENVYELALKLTARAISDNATLFLADLLYAGVIEVHNTPIEQHEPAVMIAGAHMIFPFARRVLADVTRDGGFPPLLLEPIDFATLYAMRSTQTNAE